METQFHVFLLKAAKKSEDQKSSARRANDGCSLTRSRERKVKEIRERLARQHAADKARYRGI